MRDKPYRKRVGQLLWIARSSRPDISYQVNALARVAHNPGKAHWDASTCLIQYVSHTRDFELVYRRPDTMTSGPTIWSDATWGPDYGTWWDNYRSTSGLCTTVNLDGSNIISCSLRQPVVALSSAESEWYAAVESAKEALYIQKGFKDLGMSAVSPMLLPSPETRRTKNTPHYRSNKLELFDTSVVGICCCDGRNENGHRPHMREFQEKGFRNDLVGAGYVTSGL